MALPVAQTGAASAMSLFELPAARGARTAKMALVLVVDAILAGAGIIMIMSYLDARRATDAAPAAPAPRIEVMAPTQVVETPEPTAPSAVRNKDFHKDGKPGSGKPESEQATGDRRQATGDRRPAGAAPAVPVDAGAQADAGADATDPEVEDLAGRIRAVVDSHQPKLERCYQRAAKASGPQDPLEGRIDLRFTLMPNGSAQNVRVASNTSGSTELGECVAALFAGWSMPAGASRPIDLEWPVVFRAPQE